MFWWQTRTARFCQPTDILLTAPGRVRTKQYSFRSCSYVGDCMDGFSAVRAAGLEPTTGSDFGASLELIFGLASVVDSDLAGSFGSGLAAGLGSGSFFTLAAAALADMAADSEAPKS